MSGSTTVKKPADLKSAQANANKQGVGLHKSIATGNKPLVKPSKVTK